MFIAACSDSVDPGNTTSTTAPCAANASPDGSSAAKTVVRLDGNGNGSVGLPGSVTLPLIVHATHAGRASFVVRGVDVAGKSTHVLATALGPYDGTFAVGFVDPCASPTIALDVETTGKWHFDIAEARNATRYDNGVAGKGDAVLIYLDAGHATGVSFNGGTHFELTTYGAAGPRLLAHSAKAYLGTVALPAGPIFIAVTSDGSWTLRPS